MKTKIIAFLLGASYILSQNSGDYHLGNSIANNTHSDSSTLYNSNHNNEMRPHHASDDNNRNDMNHHHHNHNHSIDNNHTAIPAIKCVIKGEYFHKCVNEKEKVIWNEDYKKINRCFKYSKCQQVNKKCEWLQTSEMKECLNAIKRNKRKPITE